MNPGRPTDYLVSAIVSTYNAERFLRGKLEDLEAQSIAAQLEIIVIDSGSPQDERSIVAEFQGRYDNIRYLRTEKRETVYQAWNRGIGMATGEFVTNANTDDRLRADALETLVRALREHPECVLAYPDMRITAQENGSFAAHQPLGFRDWPPYDRFSLLELCCVGPFPLWRRSLHAEIGYFDERYKSAADYEFWLRASLKHDFIHVPQFLGLYWLSEETVSRRGDLPTLEYLQVQKEYRARFAPLTPPPAALPPGELAHFQALSARAGDGGDASLSELERFAQLHPGFPEAHHALAQLLYQKGEIGYAKKHFEKAAILDPRRRQFSDSLAGFLRHELYQSLQHHAALPPGSPGELGSRLCAGMICILLDRTEAARLHYRRALELDPENALALRNLAALPPAAQSSESSESLEPLKSLKSLEPPAPPLTSIVILTYNEVDCTRECLESISRNTPEPHEIILVDNGSCDATLPYLRELCTRDQRYRIVENGRNLGFAAGCNVGMREARGSRILLLNNDVVVPRGWLGGLLGSLEREPGAAIAGPMSNEVAGPQRVAEISYRSTSGLEEFAAGFARANAGRRIKVSRVVGFCMLFTRELLETIGELDAGFGSGNFEDDDFCLRAALAGFACVIAGDVFIHHYGSRSFTANRIDYARAMAKNRRVYDAKWDLGRLDEPLAKKVVTRNALAQGCRLARQGRTDQAVEILLQQGIQFSPQSREPYRALARVLLDAGRFQDALEVLEQLPGGEDLESLIFAGACRSGLGDLARAQDLAERALRIDPKSAGALHLAGTLARGRGETTAAEAHLKAGSAADPGFGPCCTALAGIRWERGEREAALELAETGFVLAPLNMAALSRYHDCALACDALPREERRVREARGIFPEHQGLAFGLIEILIRRGAFREAMAEIEQATVDFGAGDAMIDAALSVRERIGPRAPAHPGKNSLSLCMIVKDEARHLPAVLLSVRPLADEMIVVDTGSSDRSADIARLFGARVFSFPWTGSFSEARNFSLAQARCGWILVLDADEVLAARDLPPLRALLERPDAPAAYSFTTRNYTSEIARKGWSANAGAYHGEERGLGWTPSDKVRLVPNDGRLRFQGAVHELLEPALVACGIPIRSCDVPVHHYGKLDTDKSQHKQEQYYLLGLKKLRETGGDYASLAELARQATELKRFPEAEELWHRLLAAVPGSFEAHFNLGYLHLAAANYPTARDHARRAVGLDPTMKEAAFNLAKCELFLGNGGTALEASREMLRRWPDYPPALSLYCACCLVLGLAGEGEAALARLGQMGFDCADFLAEYAGGLIKGGRGDLAAPLRGAGTQARREEQYSERPAEVNHVRL